MNLTTITNSHCPLPRAGATVGLPNSALSIHPNSEKQGEPECNSGRAQRAGGRSYRVPSRTRLPPYSLRTAGQAGHGTRKPLILIAKSPAKSDVRVPLSACPTVFDQPVPYQQKGCSRMHIRDERSQQETDRSVHTVEETLPHQQTRSTPPADSTLV